MDLVKIDGLGWSVNTISTFYNGWFNYKNFQICIFSLEWKAKV